MRNILIKNLTEKEFNELFELISGFAANKEDLPIINACKKAEYSFYEEATIDEINNVQSKVKLALQIKGENNEALKDLQEKFLKLLDIYQSKVDTFNNLNPNNKIS